MKADHEYFFETDQYFDTEIVGSMDVVFDFTADENPERCADYKDLTHLSVFVNAPKMSLARLAFFHGSFSCKLFGFNGLAGMFDREHLEVSLLNEKDIDHLEEVCRKLQTSFQMVEDRTGMVTPRIICMIINEAFYTVQEKTATRADINLGMKLGTNYPLGPFEFCDRIGITDVYEVLEAIYEDTKDERYKVCPLLKKEYLKETRLFENFTSV